MAISEIWPRIVSSDQTAGKPLLPALPVPARWPPPVASHSSLCRARSGSARLGSCDSDDPAVNICPMPVFYLKWPQAFPGVVTGAFIPSQAP